MRWGGGPSWEVCGGLPPTALPRVTFSFAACLVFSSIQSSWSRDTSKAARISLIISSAWGGEGVKVPLLPAAPQTGTVWAGCDLPRAGGSHFPAPCLPALGFGEGKGGFPWMVMGRGRGQKCPHDGLAVPVKGGFDEEGAQGEAQRVICVGDAGLPAGRAGLWEQDGGP